MEESVFATKQASCAVAEQTEDAEQFLQRVRRDRRICKKFNRRMERVCMVLLANRTLAP